MYKSHQLQYIALDETYSVFKEFSRFVPTKVNHYTLEEGVYNVYVVSHSSKFDLINRSQKSNLTHY